MDTNKGKLIVITRSARQALPIEGVLVTVTSNQNEFSGVVASRKSDRNGVTEYIELPTPPKSNSDSPSGGQPYSLWNIDADINGYYPVRNIGAQVYDGVTTVQTVELIPLAKGFGDLPVPDGDINFNQSQTPNL